MKNYRVTYAFDTDNIYTVVLQAFNILSLFTVAEDYITREHSKKMNSLVAISFLELGLNDSAKGEK